jgi:hypothetical protein
MGAGELWLWLQASAAHGVAHGFESHDQHGARGNADLELDECDQLHRERRLER